MKKILKVFSALLVPIVFIGAFLSGCKKHEVEVDNSGVLQDIDVPPKQNAAYEQYSKQSIEEYNKIAEKHIVDGEVDVNNEEVINAANIAAAKLYAYACYNERALDKYVCFSNQQGATDLGAMGAANVQIQDYYLRVNESDSTCGYRYHYTIKKAIEVSGTVGLAKSSFESAVTRITDNTDLYYRLEGDKATIDFAPEENKNLGIKLLQCDKWYAVDNKWGVHDVVMRKQDFIEPDKIGEDIVANAGKDNITIRGNFNVLAENIIKHSIISTDEEGCITVFMFLNTDVINNDKASLDMLKHSNSDSDTKWVASESEEMGNIGPTVVFRLWGNGLFRTCAIAETWKGKINGFNGTADKTTSFYFSYSDRDCNMSANLEMLEKVKEQQD